jgi:multidrug transporter EmrE-like cation transporter
VTLAIKLLLAPCFVVGASLTARRHGPRVGGLVGALPVVAGPILLVYALGHGRTFAAHAAAGTLLGLVSLTAFVVVYARLAGRVPWPVGLLAGWLAFGLGTFLFSAFTPPLGVAFALALAAFALGLLLLPRPGEEPAPELAPPAWDLPLRAGCALALVLVLTAVAGRLGPQLSGLLAPFPIIASVLATFTHTQRGVDETLRLLRGLLMGFAAYALFCFTLALSLPALDVAVAFALATGVAVLTQGLVLRLTLREPDPDQPGTHGGPLPVGRRAES